MAIVTGGREGKLEIELIHFLALENLSHLEIDTDNCLLSKCLLVTCGVNTTTDSNSKLHNSF